ncbi:MAG: type II secretion system secretin GspD [bacterium]
MYKKLTVIFLILSVFFSVSADDDDGEMKSDGNDVKFPVKINKPRLKKIKKIKPGNIKDSDSEKNKDEDKEEEKEDQETKKRQPSRSSNSGKRPRSANSESASQDSESEDPKRVRDVFDIIKIEAEHQKQINMKAKVHLDFNDTPLLEVIKWFSEKLHKNFILTQQVGRAKVTIMSPQPVSIREAFQTFLTTLSTNNFSVSKDGSFYVVLRENEVRSMKMRMVKPEDVPDTFEMIGTIVKPKYLSTKEITDIIKVFDNKGGGYKIIDESTIIIVDYAANVRQMIKVIEELDVPGKTDTVKLRLIELDYIGAQEAQKIIEDIFRDYQRKRQRGRRRPKQSDDVPKIKAVGQKEKKDGSGDEGDDEEILFDSSVYMKIVPDERGEQLILLCGKRMFSLVMQIVRYIDREVEGEGEIHVVKLKNAKADDMLKTLQKLTSHRKTSGRQQKNEAAVFEGKVSISSDESTNSIVVVSSYKDFKNLRNVIESLDVKRRQVYVEAAIMEVTINEDLEYGNAFSAGGFETEIAGEQIPVFFGKSLSNIGNTGFLTGLLGPALSGTENIPGVGLLGGVPSVGLIINAAQSLSNINVISTPHLLTTDNEEAEIIVGSTIPFPSGSIINNAAGAQVTYKREEVALKLKIKPQINESGYMTLEVNQELSQVQGQNDYGVITSKRSAKTIVNAEDEQTVVVGGLIKDTANESENKIPILGDIPVLGNLFKYTKTSNEKVNLLLILTPHIIESKADFNKIYERKIQERRDFAKKFYGEITEYKTRVMYSKKRGMLLSLAHKLDEEARELNRLEKEEENRGKRRNIMVTPDGLETETDDEEEDSGGDFIDLNGDTEEYHEDDFEKESGIDDATDDSDSDDEVPLIEEMDDLNFEDE